MFKEDVPRPKDIKVEVEGDKILQIGGQRSREKEKVDT